MATNKPSEIRAVNSGVSDFCQRLLQSETVARKDGQALEAVYRRCASPLGLVNDNLGVGMRDHAGSGHAAHSTIAHQPRLPEGCRPVVRLAPGQGEYRVLVVDTDPKMATILAELLGLVGFSVRETDSGSAALGILVSWAPHLIIVDTNARATAGLDLMAQIRSSDSGREIAVLTVGITGEWDDQPEEPDSRVNGHLRKPFRKDALLEAIEACLEVDYVYEEVSG